MFIAANSPEEVRPCAISIIIEAWIENRDWWRRAVSINLI